MEQTGKVFVLGATGWVGRQLCQALLARGDQVVAAVRDLARAKETLGPHVELVAWAEDEARLADCMSQCTAAINLAGEPIAEGRWTAAKKEKLQTSRLDTTARLVRIITAADPRPEVLVSASAVGYYGDAGADPVDEDSPAGEDFLGRLCRDWEAAALRAAPHGVRVVCPRIGIVLGEGGGMLKTVAPIFRAGIGGALGSGHQFMSWIHLSDLVDILLFAIRCTPLEGPVVAAGPNPVSNKVFTKALAKVLKRPAFLPAPKFAIKLLMGEASRIALDGQRAHPKALLAAGFEFRYQALSDALSDIYG